MFADLHLHTNFSDGTFTPEELTGEARRAGLAVVALTDHDTVEGCERMKAACHLSGLEFIPGAEFTAELLGLELHLLGYFLETNHPQLLRELARCQSVRQDRIREMVERLNQLRVPLDAEAVFTLANCRSPGRPHVARALVQAGFCSNLDQAFERFLRKRRPAWVPKRKMSALEAIDLIHQAGGLAVMAHPGLNRTDQLIPELAECGLDGLECWHTKHSASASERYLALAREYRLLATGGSDCHGYNKGRPLVGTVRLPYVYVQALKERAASRAEPEKPPPPAPPAEIPTASPGSAGTGRRTETPNPER